MGLRMSEDVVRSAAVVVVLFGLLLLLLAAVAEDDDSVRAAISEVEDFWVGIEEDWESLKLRLPRLGWFCEDMDSLNDMLLILSESFVVIVNGVSVAISLDCCCCCCFSAFLLSSFRALSTATLTALSTLIHAKVRSCVTQPSLSSQASIWKYASL